MSFRSELSIYTSLVPTDFLPGCFCIPDTFLYSPVITLSLRGSLKCNQAVISTKSENVFGEDKEIKYGMGADGGAGC